MDTILKIQKKIDLDFLTEKEHVGLKFVKSEHKKMWKLRMGGCGRDWGMERGSGVTLQKSVIICYGGNYLQEMARASENTLESTFLHPRAPPLPLKQLPKEEYVTAWNN